MRDGRAKRDGIDAKLCTEKLSPWDYLKKKLKLLPKSLVRLEKIDGTIINQFLQQQQQQQTFLQGLSYFNLLSCQNILKTLLPQISNSHTDWKDARYR